jgi:cytochrome b
MGFHLAAGTFNQAALARGRAGLAAAGWLFAAALFVAFVAAPTISSEVTRVEVGYLIAAMLLCLLLWAVYRQGPAQSTRPRRGRRAVAASRTR